MMPFGLVNAPGTFHRMMDEVLRGLPFPMGYVDNVLIFSDTLEHCRQVFERIKEARLKLKVTKLSFAQSEVKLLGRLVNDTGVKVDNGKVKDILEAPTTSNVTELRIFLRFAC